MNSVLTPSRVRVLALSVVGAAAIVQASPASDADTTFIPAAKVATAFAKGMPLVETAGYKIHASRREAPGVAEVHAKDTDIIYVLEGTATVVTGGDVVDARTTAADEIRGTTIRNGRAQRLTKGDVFVVANGVPHQFTAATNPFLYYVVKATTGGGR